MQICDYTVPELNRYRELCNFTPEERTLFDYRAKDKMSLECCAEYMNVSVTTIKHINKKIKSKIERVS